MNGTNLQPPPLVSRSILLAAPPALRPLPCVPRRPSCHSEVGHVAALCMSCSCIWKPHLLLLGVNTLYEHKKSTVINATKLMVKYEGKVTQYFASSQAVCGGSTVPHSHNTRALGCCSNPIPPTCCRASGPAAGALACCFPPLPPPNCCSTHIFAT